MEMNECGQSRDVLWRHNNAAKGDDSIDVIISFGIYDSDDELLLLFLCGVLDRFATSSGLHGLLVLPDAAGVVLRPRDYRVSLIVERTTEDLVLVSLQSLHLGACVNRPQPACAVASRCHNLGALRVEADLRYLALMTYESPAEIYRGGSRCRRQ